MPKKSKTTGKGRLDKFYHLAKEQGFRSRAAFKLIQLNKKYDFLRASHSLIDLCAAPGGWLQVASKFMPMGSKIIGVDLDAIKPIPHVIGIQSDITTQQCRHLLRKALAPAKLADVVLNDGSPNVGGAWAKEAYTQAELVLHAIHIAADMLRPGGTFISKVFRSQDYNALLWVLRQLFGTVSVTKPEASRQSSAEIYFVCQHYKAPKTIDPKLFNPSFVFKGVEDTSVTYNPDSADVKPLSLFSLGKLQSARRNRDGYEDGVMVLHKTYPVSKFIDSKVPVNIFAECNQLVFDDDSKIFIDRPETTEEIKTLCADLKSIGKNDMKILIKWKQAMMKVKESLSPKEVTPNFSAELTEEEMERIRDEKLQKHIELMKRKEEARMKKMRKKRSELRAKGKEAGIIANEQGEAEHAEMFNLKTITSGDVLMKLHEENFAGDADSESEEEPEEELSDTEWALRGEELKNKLYEKELDAMYAEYKVRRKEADRNARKRERALGLLADDQNEDAEMLEGSDQSSSDEMDDKDDILVSDEDEEERDQKVRQSRFECPVESRNPLSVSFGESLTKADHADLWFERDLLKDIDAEIKGSKPAMAVVAKSSVVFGPQPPPSLSKKRKRNSSEDSDNEDSDDSKPVKTTNNDEFEEVPKDNYDDLSDDPDAVAETLAIGTALLRKKRREEILNNSYNKWAFNDNEEDFPEWFADDQKEFFRPILPVTQGEVDKFKEMVKEINARPIKKIAEAKARKAIRAVRRWETLKNQAESIAENEDISPSEKFKKLQKIYRQKGTKIEKKKEKVYAVSRKAGGTSNVKNVKGKRVVRVDTRMKADKRGKKVSDKRNGLRRKRRKLS